jgi:hypothetical protein
VGIDTDNNLLHAVRGGNNMTGDGAHATFTRHYAQQHITLGYATTVHSAQGVTADTCHSLMGVKATRTLAYVAMTRGRHCNKAYLYERFRGELDHEHTSPTGTDEIHILKRASRERAKDTFHTLLLTNDDRPTTMHAYADRTPAEHLPERIASLIAEHTQQRDDRRARYTAWQQAQTRARGQARTQTRERTIEHDDAGLDL